MIESLRQALNLPPARVEPFADWLARLKGTEKEKQEKKKQKKEKHQNQIYRPSHSPQEEEQDEDTPAARIAYFLEHHFVRMSCGGVILDMTKSLMDSEPLRNLQPVDDDLVKSYVRSWEDMGFLVPISK